MNWRIPSTRTAPPGGKWIWGDAENYVEDVDYNAAVTRIALAAGCRWGDAERKLEDYMCPRIPDFCTRRDGTRAPRPDGAKRRLMLTRLYENARPYVAKPDVPADEIIRRMEVCAACPKRRREFCMACAKACTAVYDMFGGRRMKLPGDAKSGVCGCAETFDMVVASVDYRPEDPVWEGTPENCWRRQ